MYKDVITTLSYATISCKLQCIRGSMDRLRILFIVAGRETVSLARGAIYSSSTSWCMKPLTTITNIHKVLTRHKSSGWRSNLLFTVSTPIPNYLQTC
jgi:hypothetical protein